MIPTNRTLFQADVEQVLERLDDATFDLIYLDPPWYTAERLPEATSIEASEFPRYLSRVVQHCRRILTDQGSLYFHAPAVSDINFRLILDQVFQATVSLVIIVKYQRPPVSAGPGPHDHDAILRYTRSGRSVYNTITRPPNNASYTKTDDRGPYRLIDVTMPGVRPANQYEIHGKASPPNRSWRYPLAIMQQHIDAGRIEFGTNGTPRLKQYFDEVVSTGKGLEISSVWDDIVCPPRRAGHCQGERPGELASRIIRQATNEGGWFLDPFCGSGQFVTQAELLRRHWAGVDACHTAISVSLQRLQEDAHLPPSSVTRVDLGELQGIPPVCSTTRTLFMSVGELDQARHKLDLVARLIVDIKASSDLANQTEEDVLQAIAENTPRLKYIVTNSARDLLYQRLMVEIPTFSSFGASSKDFLATAAAVLDTLPGDLDFSVVSVSAWKAVENELAERVFQPFRRWFYRRHADIAAEVALDLAAKDTKVLAQYLRDGKDLALGQMKWLLDLASTSRKTMQMSRCLQSLADFARQTLICPDFLLSPTGMGSLLTQTSIDTFRNGAAHRTLFPRERAEKSLAFVFALLPKLVAGLQTKDGAPADGTPGVPDARH